VMKTDSDYIVTTVEESPDLRGQDVLMARVAWPEFMLHDPVARYFDELYDDLPQFQFAFKDRASGELLCIGNSVPLAWTDDPSELPDKGWDWALEKGIKDHQAGIQPTVLCAIQIMLPPEHRGKGLSYKAVSVMREIGRSHGLATLIAPVRPSSKSLYPLTDMENYIKWTTDEGLPFDPWLRVHARQGGRIVKVCPQAMRITGTVAEWESWAKMRFPESGKYVVPGALNPVRIDCAADQGVYIEPNVWTVHD
jgi:hypothetical protein